MPEFYMILALKLAKYPNFFYDICPKNAQIFYNNCPKNIFPDFFLGGGGTSPVSYAYGWDHNVRNRH